MVLCSKIRRILLTDNTFLRNRFRSKNHRRIGVHEMNKKRNEFGEFHHIYNELRRDSERFFNFLRMSRETFDFILSKVKFKLTKKTTNFKKPISATERLYVTLRYLSTGLSFRNLAVTLRMGASTVGKIVHETCKIIWEELVEDFMPVPNQDQLVKISDDFYRRWKFPNCIGCIDGKHCQIKCPINSGSSYFNYLKYFSLVLQGVADADKKFIFIEVGSRGKKSDGGTFAASTLFQHIQSNTFLPPDKELPGTTIKLPHVFIGDEAYPLKTFLMRPFPSRNLNAFRENYNKRLSAARKCIECAFGILRAKWRILGKDIEVSSDKAVHIIKCACILHNVVREKDGDSDLDYCQEMLYSNAQENRINNLHKTGNHGGARRGSTRAQEIRNEFAKFFLDH